ncbi:MAG: amidase, partial [Methylobacteriaceae bacterium]|nr:amidase [Methylobacteriaceae bacterium]
RYNRVWTLLGTPCVNVPAPRGPGEPPLGLQVIAPFARDELALSAALVLESALQA